MPRPSSAEAVEPIPPTLRDGESPRVLRTSDVVPRMSDVVPRMSDDLERARALEARGHALWAAGDPACREAFEDAGTLYEEVGDEAAVRAIDVLLREVANLVEESPRSFQSGQSGGGRHG